MTALETEKTETTRETLIKAGFTISQRCCSRPSCFDFTARRNGNIIFIKVQHDIGNLS
ncbi:transcriptional regulator, partial [Candidatus Bathyarchaeota archaeon]